MSPTRRGRTVLGVLIALFVIGGGVGAVLALGGKATNSPAGPGSSNSASGGSPTPTTSPPPEVCPLTGVRPSTSVPIRPALAIKVENLPAARPQTGLSWADIVYEEPVEGGITRFIAIYQCQDASRVEPVRSARLTDVDILVQFDNPLFGFAGGVQKVVKAVRAAGIIDVNYLTAQAADAYHRDPNRPAPHNLYTSTNDLYTAADGLFEPGIPDPVFTYRPKPAKGGVKGTEVHVPFSSSSDVFWKWSGSKKVWLRFHGDVPHVSSDGTQFSAKNVVVQMVKTEPTDVTDANGVTSPRAITVGTGKAYVFRNGKMYVGTWVRKSVDDLTMFLDASGKEIKLAPGQTWVELLPNDKTVSFS